MFHIVVVDLKVVPRNANSDRLVEVDGVEFCTKLTACLAERVFGDGRPQSLFSVFDNATLLGSANFASIDADFLDVLGDQVVDRIPEFWRGACQEGLRGGWSSHFCCRSDSVARQSLPIR